MSYIKIILDLDYFGLAMMGLRGARVKEKLTLTLNVIKYDSCHVMFAVILGFNLYMGITPINVF